MVLPWELITAALGKSPSQLGPYNLVDALMIAYIKGGDDGW
ncbi:hypothetical protein Krac_2091 [Ktedonobacter racemifer DSM 44963]|uniref:Uncharacterized protein n=1 Tax=Ktedonobacter racemifer DSM 44963 TaxID=485913 RepID=D6U4E6_KTERA|nr:hypothetical protein Krac_2091 [Ktedonobacter racemifer DSM 44963]